VLKRTVIKAALVFSLVSTLARAQSGYDALVQKGNTQLQAGNTSEALETGQQATKLAPERWQAYALMGGALMNLKRYEEAADNLSKAIDKAPASKQSALRDLRKQCALAEAGVAASTSAASELSPAPPASVPTQGPPVPSFTSATTTQAEVVLWKTIENSNSPSDFQTYLGQYPNGAFVGLAHTHLEQLETKEKALREQQAAQAAATAEKERLEAVTVFSVQHVHPGTSNNGTLKLSRHGLTFESPKEAGFSSTCSQIRTMRLQPKYGLNKTQTLYIETGGGSYNFWGNGDSVDYVYTKIKEVCGI
jgi:hypothetical protein